MLTVPLVTEEVQAAEKSLNKGKSPGIDNISRELVQAGGDAVISALHKICNKIWKTGEWPIPWTQSLIITVPRKATFNSARTTARSA